MLISAREAATRLRPIGLSRRQARVALDAGLAGDPIRTAVAILYDEARVVELAERPVVVAGAVTRCCPCGIVVDRRLARLVGTSPVADIPLSPWAVLDVRLAIDEGGPLPYVATVCGFVVHGAEIRAVRGGASGTYRLDLVEPGPWFDSWRGRRWPTGPGNRWLLLGRPR